MPEQTFPPEPASAAAARSFAVSASRTSGELADTVSLLTSELASNAVLHARTSFVVRVTSRSSTLRVEVADTNPNLPARKEYGPDAITGRGLRIVEGLADRWGVETEPGGKAVWFELLAVAVGTGAG
ncbi:MAG: ATP-binding protein [Actinobacteria bacterium]|nr:ATP-binding protein [Actinomycetota bacterium]